MNTFCHIHGLGVYVPAHVITNEYLSRTVDTNDEWIVSRTGIKERRMLAQEECASDAGKMAAEQALREAGLTAKDVTHLLVATCTPDMLCPSTACILAGKLGCDHIMTMDFNAACSGFVYGLALARSLVASQEDATVLLVSAEALTRRTNWTDRSTCVLFGDGAGAVVVRSRSQGAIGRIVDVVCHSDGTLNELITIGGGTKKSYIAGEVITEDFFLQMQGREVFKHAVRNMTAVCHEILDKNAYAVQDIDLLVPHQANMRIIEAVGARLHIETEKVFANVASYGNTSSASVPLALYSAREQKRIVAGSRVLASCFGAGLTWGAALLEF